MQLSEERAAPQRHDGQQANAGGLQGSDETLDDGNAARFADGLTALADAAAAAPTLERIGGELHATVGDKILGRLADGGNDAAEEAAYLLCRRLLFENRHAQHAAG